MIKPQVGSRPEDIRQGAKHVLFVEGNDDNAIDPVVLKELFRGKLDVKPLGSSFHIKSAAQAMFRHHPSYYFIIDRDHHTDEEVKIMWDNFSKPKNCNLLIWKKRELENYFLDPEYLSMSHFLSVSKDELNDKIKTIFSEYLYLDVTNHVIISVREEFKQNWIMLFDNRDDFPSKDKAITKLISANEFSAFTDKVSNSVQEKSLIERFEKHLSEITGGNDSLDYGNGKWLELLPGKKKLNQIINDCFRVQYDDGKVPQGKEKLNVIIRYLLKMELNQQPSDFQELRELFVKRGIISS
jgi:hypothetical protein